MSNTPETDAFYGELHPEQGLLEHARSLERRLQEAQERVEQLTVQLAGCGAASTQNTRNAATLRGAPGDYGYSASYAGVCAAVDREMAERDRADAALREVEELREALTHSVELQSHYAELLNMHDGGERMTFTVETWLARLAALAEKGKP